MRQGGTGIGVPVWGCMECNIMMKKKKHLQLLKHRKERMHFAIRYKDWTLEDWKRVVWSDETEINCLGSDDRKWAWKRQKRG